MEEACSRERKKEVKGLLACLLPLPLFSVCTYVYIPVPSIPQRGTFRGRPIFLSLSLSVTISFFLPPFRSLGSSSYVPMNVSYHVWHSYPPAFQCAKRFFRRRHVFAPREKPFSIN